MESFNLPVTRLIRVSYGPFQLGNLERGAVDEISGKALREQTGGKIAIDEQPRRKKAD